MKEYAQWEKYVYKKYEDLKLPAFKKLEPLTTDGKEHKYLPNGIPVERYSVPRTLTKDKIKDIKYARKAFPLYKYDLRERPKSLYKNVAAENVEKKETIKEMVQIVINLPQYIDADGKIKHENIDTFESDYSPTLLNQMLDDYLNYATTATSFDNMYRLNGSSQNAKAQLKYAKLLKELESYAKEQNRWLPDSYNTDRIWIISHRYHYQREWYTFTFCIDAKNEYQIFAVYLEQPIDIIVRDLKQKVTDVRFICGNFSLLFFRALESAFPNATFLFDYFQLPLFIDNIIKFENTPKKKKKNRKIIGADITHKHKKSSKKHVQKLKLLRVLKIEHKKNQRKYNKKLREIRKNAHDIIIEQFEKKDPKQRIHKHPVEELHQLVAKLADLQEQFPYESKSEINLNQYAPFYKQHIRKDKGSQFFLKNFDFALSYRLQTILNAILYQRTLLPERLYFHICCSCLKLYNTPLDVQNVLGEQNRTQILPFDMAMRPRKLRTVTYVDQPITAEIRNAINFSRICEHLVEQVSTGGITLEAFQQIVDIIGPLDCDIKQN